MDFFNNWQPKRIYLVLAFVELGSAFAAWQAGLGFSNSHFFLRSGTASLVWFFIWAESTLTNFIRQKVNPSFKGPYVNPAFDLFLKICNYVPVVGLAFSLANASALLASISAWNNFVLFCSGFMDVMAIMLCAVIVGSGINDLRKSFASVT